MLSDRELDKKVKRLNTFTNSKELVFMKKWVTMSENEKINYVLELISKEEE